MSCSPLQSTVVSEKSGVDIAIFSFRLLLLTEVKINTAMPSGSR